MSESMLLRVGVVVDREVIEERLVEPGKDITVGSAASNTIVVQGPQIPKSVLFFKAAADRHMLLFTEPTGRVDLGDGRPQLFSDLVKEGLVEKRHKQYQLPLNARARGKVEHGQMTVLFQYVERAGAVVPKVQAPTKMVLEATLWWNDTILSARSYSNPATVTLGPLPESDLQVPGKLLETSNFKIVEAAGGRAFLNLGDSRMTVEDLEGAEVKNGKVLLDRPLSLSVALPEGFRIDFRYTQAVAPSKSSPFDIAEPQPFYFMAGSAVLHAVILAIAFTVAQAIEPGTKNEARAEIRRELRAMIQEQKEEKKAIDEAKARENEASKKAEESAKKAEEADKKPETKKEEAKQPESRPAEARADAGKTATPSGVGTTVESSSERKERLTKSVREKTFLNNLGGGGEDGGGDNLPSAKSTELAQAFDDLGPGGNTYAKNGSEGAAVAPKSEGSGDKFKTLSTKETGGDRIETTTVKTETKDNESEAKITANVRTGQLSGQTGVGKVDPQAVASVFSRRKSAIKSCYEKELRRDSKISGRVVLKFTIGPAGRITDISATQNTTGVDSIAQCMVEKVQGWKFDPPEGGAVTFTYPFILEAN